MTARWLVSWPALMASGQPHEEYATEDAAERRAAEIVKTTPDQFAVVWEGPVGENWPTSKASKGEAA